MKTVWAIVTTSVVFSVAGLYMIFTGKVEVDPVRVMNPTNFTRPEEIGAVVFRRFWAEVQTDKLVILASSPRISSGGAIWQAFLAVGREYGVGFQSYFSQPSAPDLRVLKEGSSQEHLVSQSLDWEKVQMALAGEGRVLVHLISSDENWRAVKERTRTGLVVFQNILPVSEGAAETVRAGCGGSVELKLDCLAVKALTHGKKKKFNPSQLTATIEKHGTREHVLFVHEPR
jgi:hypothetical protein